VLFGEHIHLVMGGFRLRDNGIMELESILIEFHRLGVDRVTSCHCSEDRAIEKLQKENEKDFI
jgi:metal-dependent hydrolase (beta-lactamase superfamily II)